MSDDTDDDTINLVDQRAMAFCHVAKLADTVQDGAVKELCLTMLRKLNASIRTPSTADLRGRDKLGSSVPSRKYRLLSALRVICREDHWDGAANQAVTG